jgi:acyl-CoA synthetase (AMP-forming)/AMP-acid ligase II/acyl carrier protein
MDSMVGSRPSLAERVCARFSRAPDRPFLVLPDDGGTLTYAEFEKQVARAAQMLADAGLAAGDYAVLALANSPQYMALFLASLVSGVRLALVGPDFSADEIDALGEGLRIRAIFVDEGAPVDEGLALRCGIPVTEVRTGLANGRPAGRTLDGFWRMTAASDPAYVMCSSGSTGKPKRICTSYGNMESELEAMFTAYGLSDDDRHMCVLPLCHVSGLYRNFLMPFFQGGSIVLCKSFEQRRFWSLISRYGVNFVQVVPSILAILAEQELEPDDGARQALRYIGTASAPLPAGLLKRFEDRFGILVVQGYGLTETTCGITLNATNAAERRAASVGRPLAVNEVRIVDESGSPVPPGEEGEVVVRGDNIMLGYLGPDGLPRAPWTNGWFHTNDLGYVDEQGYLYLTGRKSDIVNRGGHKVSPVEVEKVLLEHAAVKDAVVVGVPHEVLGEDVVAYVCPKGPDGISPRELLQLARAHLPAYKIPSAFLTVESIPRRGAGKINRRAFAAAMQNAGIIPGATGRTPVTGVLGVDPAALRADIPRRVRQVVAEILDVPLHEVTDELGPGKIRTWDSIGHVRIILAIEQEFGCHLDPRATNSLRNLAELEALVANGIFGVPG